MFDMDRVPVWEGERVLETGGRDGDTMMGMHFKPWNRMLKNGKFYIMHILPPAQ